MREGYKMTILGEIPINWKLVKLDEIIDSFIVPMRDKPKKLNGHIPWCRIEDFNGIYLSKSKSDRGVDKNTINEMKLKVYPVGTVLVSCSADLGRCAITTVPLTTNQTFIGLYPKKPNCNLFIYYKMREASGRLNSLSSGTTIAYLSRKQFEHFKIVVPNDDKEQRKIADILSTVDEKIEAIDQRIARTQELKKGLMQRLLTKGISHTRFKDSPLGKIPESWEVKHLSEIINKLTGGVSVKSEDRITNTGEFGILKTSALSKGIFYPSMHKTILKSEYNRVSINPKKDTILISRMNTPQLVGECGYVQEDYPNLFLPDRIWMLETHVNLQVSAKWLSYILASPKIKSLIQIKATGTSNSMKNISKTSLLGISIGYPPLKDQHKIANILSTVDEKLEILQEKKQEYQQLKKGLMQQLLTGKMRVKVEEMPS